MTRHDEALVIEAAINGMTSKEKNPNSPRERQATCKYTTPA